MKKTISILLLSALLLSAMTLGLSSCGAGAGGDVFELSFAEANSIEEMQKNDGKKVSVVGYMSVLSPVNGEFMYLMNLPYQSCPFCIPNTTTLSNTLAIYAKDGKSFEFTDMLIRVEGVLEFGDYTDEYGYQYSYRIKDATYTKVDTSELSDQYLLWQQLAQTGVIGDVYSMYDYVNFLCFWPSYTVMFETGKDYLYPNDALALITNEGQQFNYGYKDGYFEGMISRIESVDKEAFAGLVSNIRRAQTLAQKALADLQIGNYSLEDEYSDIFKDGRKQYKTNNHEEYLDEMNTIFAEFSEWISEWEIK